MADDSWLQLQVSLFQSDVIDQTVIDSAVEWAYFNKHVGGDDESNDAPTPVCWDQDTCGFFFDGTVIETIFSASGVLDSDSFASEINHGGSYVRLCTMSLTEEQQDRLLPYVHAQWTQKV